MGPDPYVCLLPSTVKICETGTASNYVSGIKEKGSRSELRTWVWATLAWTLILQFNKLYLGLLTGNIWVHQYHRSILPLWFFFFGHSLAPGSSLLLIPLPPIPAPLPPPPLILDPDPNPHLRIQVPVLPLRTVEFELLVENSYFLTVERIKIY
jgi:hypothetical protein